jgi:hypothetical protein
MVPLPVSLMVHYMAHFLQGNILLPLESLNLTDSVGHSWGCGGFSVSNSPSTGLSHELCSTR